MKKFVAVLTVAAVLAGVVAACPPSAAVVQQAACYPVAQTYYAAPAVVSYYVPVVTYALPAAQYVPQPAPVAAPVPVAPAQVTVPQPVPVAAPPPPQQVLVQPQQPDYVAMRAEVRRQPVVAVPGYAAAPGYVAYAGQVIVQRQIVKQQAVIVPQKVVEVKAVEVKAGRQGPFAKFIERRQAARAAAKAVGQAQRSGAPAAAVIFRR